MDQWQADASLPSFEQVKDIEHTAAPLEAADLATSAPTLADRTERLRPGRWQYLGLSLAFLAVSAVWGAGLQVLLPQQVAAIAGNAQKVAVLGLVTGVSAIVAMAWAPIAGFLSDRTRSRLGRRNIWVLCGALATALLLLLLGQAATIPLVMVLWCGVQLTTNSMSSPLTAVIPERFPTSRRGTISALTGIGALLGTFVGVAVGGLTHSFTAGWLTVGGVILVLGALYALTAREPIQVREALAREADARVRARRAGTSSKLDLPRNADYWWAFAGRFGMILGIQSLSGYQYYIVSDYLHLGQTNPTLPVATAIVILSGLFTLFILPSMAVAGWLSDKVGRVKPFVFLTSLGFAVPMALLLFIPSWPTMLVAQAINGIVFGMYLAVDQALMSRVLPNVENAARDLGILNIANAGPQALAPFVASLIITFLGGYHSLFLFGIVVVVLGALTVRQIRSVN
jgi:MFS family permease